MIILFFQVITELFCTHLNYYLLKKKITVAYKGYVTDNFRIHPLEKLPT